MVDPRTEREQLQVSIGDLERGAHMNLTERGPQKRLCVMADSTAVTLSALANKDDVDMAAERS
jgi:hypothetical protein